MNKKTNDIADCEELWDNIVSERGKLLMTCMAEKKYLNRTKFDLGQWISRKWLYNHTALISMFIEKRGITFYDDMRIEILKEFRKYFMRTLNEILNSDYDACLLHFLFDEITINCIFKPIYKPIKTQLNEIHINPLSAVDLFSMLFFQHRIHSLNCFFRYLKLY